MYAACTHARACMQTYTESFCAKKSVDSLDCDCACTHHAHFNIKRICSMIVFLLHFACDTFERCCTVQRHGLVNIVRLKWRCPSCIPTQYIKRQPSRSAGVSLQPSNQELQVRSGIRPIKTTPLRLRDKDVQQQVAELDHVKRCGIENKKVNTNCVPFVSLCMCISATCSAVTIQR